MATVAKMKPRKKIPAAEWDVRVDLAACYRLVAHYGMTDLALTHISARVPGNPDHLLLNPYGLLFDEITASDDLVVLHQGRMLARGRVPDVVARAGGQDVHSAFMQLTQGSGGAET